MPTPSFSKKVVLQHALEYRELESLIHFSFFPHITIFHSAGTQQQTRRSSCWQQTFILVGAGERRDNESKHKPQGVIWGLCWKLRQGARGRMGSDWQPGCGVLDWWSKNDSKIHKEQTMWMPGRTFWEASEGCSTSSHFVTTKIPGRGIEKKGSFSLQC